VNVVIVSPHFDDAVLSCWSVIEGDDDVSVVTVFTGGPEPGFISEWDRDTGVDSATRMVQRAEENRAALALAGREPTDLGFLEIQYESGEVDAAALEPYLRAADVVYLPAGVGVEHVNAEHIVVRDACLAIRDDVWLYADQPYSLFRSDTRIDARVVELTPDQRVRKARAIACYAGEIAKLEAAFGSITDEGRLGFEVFWPARS
jgi:LmbE family N-acetylglucosaminyl deacetylase